MKNLAMILAKERNFGGSCLTVWTEGGVFMGGWGAQSRDVGSSRNDGLKEEQWSRQQIGPEGRILGGALTE